MSGQVERINKDNVIEPNVLFQEYTASMAEGIHRENIQRMFIDKSEKTMGGLGVIKIFRDLRDKGDVVWDNISHYESKKTLFGLRSNLKRVSSFTPAKITLGTNRICVSIAFDHVYSLDGEQQKRVSVMQDDKGNLFVQSGGGIDFNERVNNRNDIPDLISDAINAARRH